MKIRWRLTWYGIGFTALSLTVFIGVITLLVVGSAQQDQDELLGTVADEIAASLAEAGAVDLTPAVPPVLPDAPASDQPFFMVYDDRGTLHYATGTVEGRPLELPGETIAEAMTDGTAAVTVSGVRVQVRRWENPAVGSGVVAVAQSTDVVAEQLQGIRWFLAIFGVIALVAAAIGAWFMAGRALRPLKLLAATTDDIGSTGDLSRRLPPVHRRDEVGVLTDSFNAMLDGIEAARRDRELVIEAQKRFVADASHELRSPVTSIRANAGFLIDHPDADERDRLDATSDIAVEADRMSELIDRLLTLARADVDTDGDRTLEPVDLVGVARSVERRARNLDLALTVEADAAVVVHGNEGELADLLWVLVDNANRHGATRARLTVQGDGDRARVVVADDGPGVPAGEEERIFERFHRADVARTGSGYGLGLAIARAIVKRHWGSISVTASGEGGAAFTVVLPAGEGRDR